VVKYRREEWFDIIGDEPCTGVKERLSPIQDDYDVIVDYLLECVHFGSVLFAANFSVVCLTTSNASAVYVDSPP